MKRLAACARAGLFALLALVAPLVAACEKTEEMLPLEPGGGGGTGNPFKPDAAMTGTDASALVTGRVCLLLANLQTPGTCAPEAGELTVRLGSSMAQTAMDGSFTLMRPANPSGLTWLVSRGDVITSAIKFGATTSLPVFDATAYQDMIANNNVSRIEGSGAMIVRVRRAGVAVTGATVATAPPPDPAMIFYDGLSDAAWETTATGGYGAAWIPSLPVGSATVTITADMMPTTTSGHPVFADALTFVFADVP